MNSRAEGSSVSSSIVLLFSSQYVVSNSIIGSGGVEVGSIVACIVEDSVREFSCTLLMCLIVHLSLLGKFRDELSTKYSSPNSRQLPRQNITRSTSLSTISTVKVRSVPLSYTNNYEIPKQALMHSMLHCSCQGTLPSLNTVRTLCCLLMFNCLIGG
jgi:hypothetical protein